MKPAYGSSLQELTAQHQSQDDYAFLVDLAMLETSTGPEASIARIRREYGIIESIPFSNDDPIVLQQSGKDPSSKKALYYQRLYLRYLQEYTKRVEIFIIKGFPYYFRSSTT